LREKPQPQAEQRAQPVSLPRALPFRLQTPALQESQASVLQPQVPPLDASAPLSPPRPSSLCPLWPWLLPLLPRPLLPAGACALSPQHQRVWSSSASSFP
jgi:hypothetical protein